jgi:hypothetical protein
MTHWDVSNIHKPELTLRALRRLKVYYHCGLPSTSFLRERLHLELRFQVFETHCLHSDCAEQ